MALLCGFRLILLSLILCSVAPVYAEIYQYEDKTGKKIYVDSLSKVPQEYQDQLTSRKLQQQNLTQEQVEALEYQTNKANALFLIGSERSKIQTQLKKWVTPFQLSGQRIIVPVKVYYGHRSKQVSLIMDTGASVTVVHRSALTSLNPAYRKGANARVADGSVVKTQSIHFDRMEIGPYKAENIVSTVIDYQGGGGQAQGLLGMDFLYNAKFDLDKENKQIIWEPELYAKYQNRLQALDKQEQQLRKGVALPASEPKI